MAFVNPTRKGNQMNNPQATVDLAANNNKDEGLVRKKAVSAPEVLNEAYDYQKPSSFTRALRLDIRGVTIILISGTASVD